MKNNKNNNSKLSNQATNDYDSEDNQNLTDQNNHYSKKNKIYKKKRVNDYYTNSKINKNQSSISNSNSQREEIQEEFSDEISFKDGLNTLNNDINDSNDENENYFKNKKKRNSNENISMHRYEGSDSMNYNNNNRKENSLKTEGCRSIERPSIILNIPKLNQVFRLRNSISNSFPSRNHYSNLAYMLLNKNSHKKIYKSITSNIKNIESIYNNEKEWIIRKWGRIQKNILDKIIKIQSIWKGFFQRKNFYEIIYYSFLCEYINKILSKTLSHHARLYVLYTLFPEKKAIKEKILKVRKMINKYQFISPFFQRWKCITKLIHYRNSMKLLVYKSIFPTGHIRISSKCLFDSIKIIKKKIYIVNVKDIIRKKYFWIWEKSVIINKFLEKAKFSNSKEDMFKDKKKKITLKTKNDLYSEYSEISNRKALYIGEETKNNFDLKILFLNSIYLKMRLNRVREAFDYIYQYKPNYNDIQFLKRYYFYKWRNQVKNIELKEMRSKFLAYIIENLTRKSLIIKKYKYFSRWKLFTDDYFNKAKNREELIQLLICITIKKKVELDALFLKFLIKKWENYVSAKKKELKMLRLYKIIQKTYCKMVEELIDIDKKIENKYNFINTNEDDKNCIENIKNAYNSKIGPKYKFKYHN